MVILGSTGSIGTQALDIVRRNPDRFRVVALAAGGGSAGLLARQAVEFGVPVVAVADEAAAGRRAAAIKARQRPERERAARRPPRESPSWPGRTRCATWPALTATSC